MSDENELKELGLDNNALPTIKQILGYLNFSNGTRDPEFAKNVNLLAVQLKDQFTVENLCKVLDAGLRQLSREDSLGFEDVSQAEVVMSLAWTDLFRKYLSFHEDLIFHLEEQSFGQPFFLVRLAEAVLQEGSPWNETERILQGAMQRLNDFLGLRPVAILENDRLAEPYDHERFCPCPLYFREAGVAYGPYELLLELTLKNLADIPGSLLETACFDLSLLDEIALDYRAHDHTHPSNKRTNYMFGEWDPHEIDNKGYYRRFILRSIILDALVDWVETQDQLDLITATEDASRVLCGTLLMASAISGSGPGYYDSETSLSTLLPIVAGLRDNYYESLLQTMSGAKKRRHIQILKETHQPYGHVRHGLNMYLADYGARQVQLRELALLYARMGYPVAARRKAAQIPSLSIRFESELQLRMRLGHLYVAQNQPEAAAGLLEECEDLFERGIHSGGLIDPWNILGFQGHYPLFQTREDVTGDQRAEILLELASQMIDLYTAVLGEAAVQRNHDLKEEISQRFLKWAQQWDRYATHTVNDLPTVYGVQSWESACRVAETLEKWEASDEASGSLMFWKDHIDSLQSAHSYALVIQKLLQQKDTTASMGLLMQWLSEADEVGLEVGNSSIHILFLQFMKTMIEIHAEPALNAYAKSMRRLFEFLEANAEAWCQVPSVNLLLQEDSPIREEPGWISDLHSDEEFDAEGESNAPFDEEEEQLYQAAYDQVIYRDSTDDGIDSNLADGDSYSSNTEFDLIARTLEPRLKFLNTIAQLWEFASLKLLDEIGQCDEMLDRKFISFLYDCRDELLSTRLQLRELLEGLWKKPTSSVVGNPDENLEYDLQLQRKFFLVQQCLAVQVHYLKAGRLLQTCLDYEEPHGGYSREQFLAAETIRFILLEQLDIVRRKLPQLLENLSKKPLLYAPLENGGDPQSIVTAKNRQAVLEFLLHHLPRLGLFRETWHVLGTAYSMEKNRSPAGVAITEFDRLFHHAVSETVERLVPAIRSWEPAISNEDILTIVDQVLSHYMSFWRRHSETMRLSAVESIESESDWEDIEDFINKYGEDLFHSRQLNLSHIRVVLHHGVDLFLEHLSEHQDPLHPLELIEALNSGECDYDEATHCIEMLYRVIVDKFDRFLEYNTTTIQSDYGNKLFSFLEFLRLESQYDRNAWLFSPLEITHQALCTLGETELAYLWEEQCREETQEIAEEHLASLKELEQQYGMRLPSVRDRLQERFVKPMAVNRMIGLVPRAMQEVNAASSLQSKSQDSSSAFQALEEEIDAYLVQVCGSGIEIPPWLRQVQQKVEDELELQSDRIVDISDYLNRSHQYPTQEELESQLDNWTSALDYPSETNQEN